MLNKPIVGMITGPGGAGYFLVASDGGIFSFGTAPFFGSLGGQSLKHPIVAAAATPTDNGYWFTDTAGLVSNFGSANYYGSAPSNLFRPIVGMAEAPGKHGGFHRRDLSHRVPTATTSASSSATSLPGGDHQIGIVQVDGSSSGNTNPCLAQEAAVGRRRAQPLHLPDLRHLDHQPSRAATATRRLQCRLSGRRSTPTTTPRRPEQGRPASRGGSTSRTTRPSAAMVGNTAENAVFVQGALNALHETEGIADVGIYASPGVWNSIVGNYAPSVPYWMADYLSSPSGPGSCADYSNWVNNHGAHLPGPPQIVQYNSAQYDDDYAC